jgi:hypothetical protein
VDFVRLIPKARMAGLALLFGSSATALTQLGAPTAFSNFAGCARHTCTWVPSSGPKTFEKGDLAYAVEEANKGDDGDSFVVRRHGKVLLRTPLKDLSASVSVVWSDDASRFAVTWSDGGAIGNFSVRVFQIAGDSVSELPAIERATAAFSARHLCKARGDNVQAFGWLSKSRDLVLVLSVYPTSDCGKDLGHTEAYVVDSANGAIRQHWGLKTLNDYMRAHPEE